MSGFEYLGDVKFNYPFYCFAAASVLIVMSLLMPVIAILQADLPFWTYSVKDLYDLGESIVLIALVLSLLLTSVASFLFYQGKEFKTMATYMLIVKLILDVIAFYKIWTLINALNHNQFDDRVIVFDDIFTFGAGSYFLALSFSIVIVGLVLEFNYNRDTSP